MKISPAGLDLIKKFEGLRLAAYPDPATGGEPWTIGYGHTGPEVHRGLTWTHDQAEAALEQAAAQRNRDATAAEAAGLTGPGFTLAADIDKKRCWDVRESARDFAS